MDDRFSTFCHRLALVRRFYSVSSVRYRSHVVFVSFGTFVTGPQEKDSVRRGIPTMVARTHEPTHPTKDPAGKEGA